MQGKCRHCKTSKDSNPAWGLCHTCYRLYRDQYTRVCQPITRRGVALDNKEPPLGSPTHHLPGTPEKAAVVAARAEAGLHLWHPDDARDTDQSPGWGRLELADHPQLASERPPCPYYGPRPSETRFSFSDLDHEP